MNDHTNSPNETQPKQMSLWNGDTSDNRPLPLIVADRWSFTIQHYETEDGYLYAIQDWIAGLTGGNSKQVAMVWANFQRSETLFSKQQLDYLASDGKTYERDYTDDKGLYQIAQFIRSTKARPMVKEIKDYLATAGAFVDEIRTNPAAAAQLVDSLETRHQLTRAKGIEKRNLLTKTAQETHVTHQPDYVALTNAEYGVLFGAAKHELVKALNLTKTQAARFRDHISTLALTALDMAETAAAMRMEQLGRRLSTDEQIEIVLHAARIVAPTVNELADYLSVDLLSGKPLLKSGN